MTDPDARDLYLSSYLQTYIERDVRELLGIEKRREFEVFVRMCALRTAQVLNYDELARDARIPAPQPGFLTEKSRFQQDRPVESASRRCPRS